MVTTGVIVTFGLLCILSYVLWAGSRPNPTSQMLSEIVVAAEQTAPTAPKAPKRRRSASPTLACPHCGTTRSRRGEIKTARALGAHVGRCKSKKRSRK